MSDRSKIGSTSFGSLHAITDEWPDGTWVRIDLDPSAIPEVDVSGDTIFCARERHDLDNIEPAPEPEGQALHRLFWGFDDTSISPCRLVVKVQS